MKDKYEVIDEEEPRGQSVAENGIPCTARHCVTQLNRLVQENEKLEKEGNNGYNQAKKAIEPLNNIISSIVDEEYNRDFINEMKNIEQEKSIPITCQQLVEEHEKNKKLKNHHKTSIDRIQQLNRSVMKRNCILTKRLHEIDKLLNDLYEGIDEHYTETLENNDELAIVRAEAQLNLITSIINEVDRIWLKK